MKTKRNALSRKAKLEVIRRAVSKWRKKLNITKLPGPLPELSCFSHGEYHNLFWRSLLYSDENVEYGCSSRDGNSVRGGVNFGWGELKNPEILDGVYDEVVKTLKERGLKI